MRSIGDNGEGAPVLKRIHIKGYKSLADVEVTLGPLAVLFGPNATGKSNFLDALQLLSKLATSKRVQEAFDPPYRGKPLESFALGADGVRGLVEKHSVRFSIEADIELSETLARDVDKLIFDMRRPSGEQPLTDDHGKPQTFVKERYLRYRVEIEMIPKTGIIRVTDEYLAALNDKGTPTGKRKPFIERQGDRLHLRLEGQAHPTYFDLRLDHTLLSIPHYAPHYPHLVAVRRELASWLFFYFEPRERMRAASPVKEVRHVGLMGEDLAAFLNTLKALDKRQFAAVERALRTMIPSISGIDVHVNDLGEVDLYLKEHGVPIPARVLSEGTLRLLGLLALEGAKERPSLVGFEEPENGIHPRRIELVSSLLRARAQRGDSQYIVTTHSPVLADLLPETALFAVRRTGLKTTIEPLSCWGPLGRRTAVDAGLDDQEGLPVSERILRGDFDA